MQTTGRGTDVAIQDDGVISNPGLHTADTAVCGPKL